MSGCDREEHALGLCQKHYLRQRTNGDPLVVRRIARGPNGAPSDSQQCRICHQILPLSEFYRRQATYRTDCKYCTRKRAWESGQRVLTEPERWRVRRNGILRRKYGLTADQYDAMWSEQDGRCYLCGVESGTLHVDHDHKTGVVRRLLCRYCNSSIGWVEGAMHSDMARIAAYIRLGSATTTASHQESSEPPPRPERVS